jgi:hypothetical protein
MNSISSLIESIRGEQPRMNPTEIYNEGWMTRLLVYYSVQENLTMREIPFGDLHNWTSEGLISSPFVFANKFREGYTHADMVLGDFSINYAERGEISVHSDAKLFGIIEAKMGSPLSSGTKHAPNYNQASRNIACIAYNTRGTHIPTFFGVVAPASTLIKHQVEEKLSRSFYVREIEERFKMYEDENPIQEFKEEVYRRTLAIRTFMLSYEEWIKSFEGKKCYDELAGFYEQCLKWNRLRN